MERTSRLGSIDFSKKFEEFKVEADHLVDKVRELIHQGNVRRIIIKDSQGHTFMEIPLTVAAVGVIAAPILTVVGALAAMVGKFTVVTERSDAAESASTSTTPPQV